MRPYIGYSSGDTDPAPRHLADPHATKNRSDKTFIDRPRTSWWLETGQWPPSRGVHEVAEQNGASGRVRSGHCYIWTWSGTKIKAIKFHRAPGHRLSKETEGPAV